MFAVNCTSITIPVFVAVDTIFVGLGIRLSYTYVTHVILAWSVRMRMNVSVRAFVFTSSCQIVSAPQCLVIGRLLSFLGSSIVFLYELCLYERPFILSSFFSGALVKSYPSPCVKRFCSIWINLTKSRHTGRFLSINIVLRRSTSIRI